MNRTVKITAPFAIVAALAGAAFFLFYLGERVTLYKTFEEPPARQADHIDPSTVRNVMQTDVLVVGESLGGMSAAFATASNGIDTLLVASTHRYGGAPVHAGLSAFDSAGQKWENQGLVKEMQNYLGENVYPTLGNASLGIGPSIATLPEDIERFIQYKIDSLKQLRTVNKYRLVQLIGNPPSATGAIFAGVDDPSNLLLVRFNTLIDGTETGEVFGKTGSFDIGFDSREKTGEVSAFPSKVRDFLVYGYKIGKKIVQGIGNRTQSTGVIFSLLDKGFAGDFYGITEKTCYESSPDAKPMMVGGSVSMLTENCEANIEIRPDFSDTYDIYFMNHGNTSVRMIVSAADGETLTLEKTFVSSKKFIKMGTYYFGNDRVSSVRILGEEKGLDAEGVVLLKKNFPHPPIYVENVEKDTSLEFQNEYGFADATVYADIENDDAIKSFYMKINGTEFMFKKVSQGTWFSENVNISAGKNSLSFRNAIPARLKVVFTGESTKNRVILTEQNGKVQPAEKGSSGTWTFNVKEKGKYLIVTDWNPPKYTYFRISHRDVPAIFARYDAPYLNADTPLAFGVLEAGKEYVLNITAPLETDPSKLAATLIHLESSGIELASGKAPSIKVSHSGMFDVWIKDAVGPGGELQCTYETEPCFVAHDDEDLNYQHAGTFFLQQEKELVLKSNHEIDVLVIPNRTIDVYRRNMDSFSASANIQRLDEGKYEMVSDSPVRSEAVRFTHDVTGKTQTGTIFLHTGGPLTVGFIASDAPSAFYLFEAIPRTGDTFKAFRNLFSETTLNLFKFRNIVTRANLPLLMERRQTIADVSNDSHGVALVLDFNSDYSPVLAGSIDDPALYRNSKALAYSYYYWLKYMMPKSAAFLGCDTLDQPLCNSKRVEMLMDLLGTDDGFAEENYIREGRRAKTLKPITENDLLLGYRKCNECTRETCLEFESATNICLEKTQTAILFDDAVGAAFYPLDFHTFFAKKEQYIPNEFINTMKKKGFLQSDEQPLFKRTMRAAPSEITLGSIIPADGSNIYPASTNFGVTQIANSGMRTHLTEITIGTAVGELLSYVSLHKTTPMELYKDPASVKAFQHYLIEKNHVVYPIDDMMESPLAVRAVQHLIADKKIAVTTKKYEAAIVKYYYSSHFAEPIDSESTALGKELDAAFDENFTYGKLLPLFTEKGVVTDKEGNRTIAMDLGLLDDKTSALSAEELDQTVISKGTLYKAYYLLKGSQWK